MYKVYALLDKDKIVYVGYTKRSLHDRWRRHKQDYPERERLKIQLLQEFENKEQAKAAEVLFQKQYDTVKNGLNKCYGHTNHDGSRLIEPGRNTRIKSGQKLNEELRIKNLREAIKNQRKKVRCTNTGIEYESISECAKVLNLSIGNLSLVLRGKRPHTKGLKFEFC
jgi:predicted GIY-YIG superfamily endonuclease